MEPNNDVVGEHTLRILFKIKISFKGFPCRVLSPTNLLRSASFEGKLNLIAQVAFADDLASTVTIEIRVGDTVKLLIEFHIHLFGEKHNSVTFLRKKEFQSVGVAFTPTQTNTRIKCVLFANVT